jgi:hypothetical protein
VAVFCCLLMWVVMLLLLFCLLGLLGWEERVDKGASRAVLWLAGVWVVVVVVVVVG